MGGDVVAVGRGARDEKGEVMCLAVKPGDPVLFGKWCGTEVTIDGENLLVLRETLMMGALESAAAPVRKAA
jgi:chaperonin GroES